MALPSTSLSAESGFESFFMIRGGQRGSRDHGHNIHPALAVPLSGPALALGSGQWPVRDSGSTSVRCFTCVEDPSPSCWDARCHLQRGRPRGGGWTWSFLSTGATCCWLPTLRLATPLEMASVLGVLLFHPPPRQHSSVQLQAVCKSRELALLGPGRGKPVRVVECRRGAVLSDQPR